MHFKVSIPNSLDFIEFEAELKDFNSKKVTYQKPEVWRLWIQVGEYRVNLHKIFKSDTTELYHPHPWAMTTSMLEGECEVGFGFGLTRPELCSKSIYTKNSSYEMTHPHLWHYVRPLSDFILTIMVSGKPWENNTDFNIHPKTTQPELTLEEKEILWTEICSSLNSKSHD